MDSGDMKVTSCMESRGMEEALDSEVTPISDMAPEVLPDSIDVLSDSVEVVPESIEVVSDSVEMVPDSVEVLQDSVEVPPDSVESMCTRCGTFHTAASSKKPASKLVAALAPVHVVVFFTKTTTWQQGFCMIWTNLIAKFTFLMWTSL